MIGYRGFPFEKKIFVNQVITGKSQKKLTPAVKFTHKQFVNVGPTKKYLYLLYQKYSF